MQKGINNKMTDEKEIKILKVAIAIVYSVLAIIIVAFAFKINNLKENNTVTRNVVVTVPADVAKTNTVKVTITPEKTICYKDSREDYITNLQYYNGNINFSDVYDASEYWCNQYDINLNFFLALMYVESKYQNGVVSCANCVGLCQLSSDVVDQFNTAMWKSGIKKHYTLEEVRWDWEKNIEVSCWFLDWLWTYRAPYTTNTRTYIQSYNYGRTGVKDAIKKNDFSYADAIIKYRDALNNL